MNIKPKDLLGNYKLKVKIKNSVPACMECLPPTSLEDHPSYNGIPVHSRIDCPDDTIYLLNTNLWRPTKQK